MAPVKTSYAVDELLFCIDCRPALNGTCYAVYRRAKTSVRSCEYSHIQKKRKKIFSLFEYFLFFSLAEIVDGAGISRDRCPWILN